MQEDQIYLTPDQLFEKMKTFTKNMAVTRDKFELVVPKCTLEDIEWNHMDQRHRFSVHRTYEKSIRIATGKKYAVSLTQWGKWPFFITVSDVYVSKGLFYQTLTLAGAIVLHSIVSMEEDKANNSVKLIDEWFIASHKIFKFLHPFLSKKLHKLNARLQVEDEPLRQDRFDLRNEGYTFKTDKPDYCNCNRLSNHTIYPTLVENAQLKLDDITDQPTLKKAGNINFLVKSNEDGSIDVWPATCPHEGGPLAEGKLNNKQITCPWHSLRFSAVTLSADNTTGSRYGFTYTLDNNIVYIKQNNLTLVEQAESLPEEMEA